MYNVGVAFSSILVKNSEMSILTSTRGVKTRAHGAQVVRGLKRDFRAKLRFYWVKWNLKKK